VGCFSTLRNLPAGGVLAAVTGLGFPRRRRTPTSFRDIRRHVIGAWFAGLAGDWYGRRFSYQINLLVFA